MRSIGGAQSLELFCADPESGRDARRLRCNAAARPPVLRFLGMVVVVVVVGCVGDLALELPEQAPTLCATAAAASIRGWILVDSSHP